MEEYPECPKCLDIYGINSSHIRAPKILKCGDSICKECLEEIIKSTKEDFFLCPECNKNIKKEQNIDEYITNKELIRLINSSFNIPKKDIKPDEEVKIPQYNVALLGDSLVGKTSIFNRLSKEIFTDFYKTTIGIDITTYYIKFKNKRYKLVFHDTAGQEKYQSITKSLLRQKDGVLFIYDISNQESFNSLAFWFKTFKEENEKIVGLLVGNKCDCEHKVNKEEAIKFAKEHGLKYIETSAKLDKNIKKAVAIILEEIIESKALYNSIGSISTHSTATLQSQKLKKKSCGC